MVALKTLIFTILVPGTLLGIVPWFLLHWSGEMACSGSTSTWSRKRFTW